MTAHASVETALEAIRLGAQDYLLKPLIFEDVLRKVQHLMSHRKMAWENQLLRREVNGQFSPDRPFGRSRAMQEIWTLIRKVAPAPTTVLLTGESDVGKEVVARAIHANSSGNDNVFLPVNCSAIPENLLESQLFGHMKGSFTGAVGSQEGLFLERAMILGNGEWISPADLPGQRSHHEEFGTEDDLTKAIELYGEEPYPAHPKQGWRRQNARCRAHGAESLNTLSQDRKARRRILSVTPQASAKMKPSFV
jgi:hypothetical protein